MVSEVTRLWLVIISISFWCALVIITGTIGRGALRDEIMYAQAATDRELVALNSNVIERIDALANDTTRKLDALATPPTILKAPEGAFWLGPRECPTDAPCAITLFFGQGKPADLQLVPYVPQGAPAAAPAVKAKP